MFVDKLRDEFERARGGEVACQDTAGRFNDQYVLWLEIELISARAGNHPAFTLKSDSIKALAKAKGFSVSEVELDTRADPADFFRNDAETTGAV